MNTTANVSMTIASDGNGTEPTIRAYQPFSNASIIASASILLPLMVLGICGNLITILVISSCTKLKSVFNQFILSLCASDLISAIMSPLYLYRRTWGYVVWNIPSFLCKVYWAADMLTSYVTALHILLFAVLRLISIRWPHIYNKMKIKHAQMFIPLVWLTAFLAGFMPFAWWFDASIRRRGSTDMDARWPACTVEPEWNGQYTLYNQIAYPIFFYAPTVLIIALTISIAKLLWLRQREREEKLQKRLATVTETKLKKTACKDKEAMLQLGMIAGSFILGYVPFTVYEIIAMVNPSNSDADEQFWWKFGVTAYICLRISETLNPIFYNLSSPKLRRHTIMLLGQIYGIVCRRGQKTSKSSSDDKCLPPTKEMTIS